jgi:predicted aconitase
MKLTKEEELKLAGKEGEAVALAMRILVQLGELYQAEEMQPISKVHIDGCCYQTAGDAGLDFAEKLASLGAKVVVPTTTNITGRDIKRWREFKMPEWLAEKCQRMEEAYLSMGVIPTWTCAPYLTAFTPRFGEQIVWAESNAIVYVNSVIGARTHRYGDFVDACAAITGRAPRFGLHLSENRQGEVLVRMEGFGEELISDTSLYALLGYKLGLILGSKIPVIEGIPSQVTQDCLKALSAAGAASGSMALFHIVGVTPEAITSDQIFKKKVPDYQITIQPQDLKQVRAELNSTNQEEVDLIALGCPHFSYSEFFNLLKTLKGRKISPKIKFFIFTNRDIYRALYQSGLLKALIKAGIQIATDTCILHWDWILSAWDVKVMATNSGKFAKYAPGLLGLKIKFGNLKECVEAGISGRIRKL